MRLLKLLECLKVAFASLWANKMRSFLTMLGIIIGISSVITIVSLGQGSQAQIGNEFQKIGTNRFVVYMNWSENPPYNARFDDDDIKTIRRVFGDQIRAISPNPNTNATVTKGRETAPVYLYFVNEEYDKIESFDIIKGRFLQESDVKGNRQICVIDSKLAMKIFKRTDVLGEKITIDTGYSRMSFTIAGVYEMPPSAFDQLNQQFGEQRTSIYVPLTAGKKLGIGDRYYMIEINANDNAQVDTLSQNIIKLVERRHRNNGKNYYIAVTAQQQMETMNNVLGILAQVIGAIAAISLLVGGIGVMNIMLVSVTERTREIGIRKAIGATRKDVLIQFLVEAMFISGTGGLIGTILGLIIQSIISMSLGLPPVVSIPTIAIAVLFSCAVGVFFGIYPANKAAKLDPIDALRYE